MSLNGHAKDECFEMLPSENPFWFQKQPAENGLEADHFARGANCQLTSKVNEVSTGVPIRHEIPNFWAPNRQNMAFLQLCRRRTLR